MDYPLNGLCRSPGGRVLALSDLRAVRGPPPAAWVTEGQDALVANALVTQRPRGAPAPPPIAASALGLCEAV